MCIFFAFKTVSKYCVHDKRGGPSGPYHLYSFQLRAFEDLVNVKMCPADRHVKIYVMRYGESRVEFQDVLTPMAKIYVACSSANESYHLPLAVQLTSLFLLTSRNPFPPWTYIPEYLDPEVL